MNESLVKYLAGLLDADGHLGFRPRRDNRRHDYFSLGLKLTLGASDNVDRHGFVVSLPDLTGMGQVHRPASSKVPYTVWTVGKRSELEMLLPRLIKHMVIKAKHWQWLLNIWRDLRAKGYGHQSVTDDELALLAEACKHSRRNNVGPLKPKNYPSWAWLAGYLDGDGWYLHRNPKKNRYGMHVGACAHITDASVLEFLHKAFGGKLRPHSQSPNLVQWERSLSNANRSFALRFLPKVAKHSRLKRHKIDLMLHHHRQRLSIPGAAAQATV